MDGGRERKREEGWEGVGGIDGREELRASKARARSRKRKPRRRTVCSFTMINRITKIKKMGNGGRRNFRSLSRHFIRRITLLLTADDVAWQW